MLRKTAIALAVMATAAGLTTLPAQAAKPVVTGHEALTHGMVMRNANAGKGARPTKASNLTYHGGAVNMTPRVVIVYWGNQWGNPDPTNPDLDNGNLPSNDPAGEAALQRSFFDNVGGNSDTWSASTLQYCKGDPLANVRVGATSCSPAAPTYNRGVVYRTWLDNTNGAAPSKPSQNDLAAEAVRASIHFGAPADVQYIIDTATGNNATGFGSQYCAWHSSTSYAAAGKTIRVAYTNMPYVSDAGSACGANFIKPPTNGVNGATEGVTIVGGHEWAETVTDEYPNGGWLDSSGAENGDKCAWIAPGTRGGSAIVQLGSGHFAVQSLWSNAVSGCAGTT